MTHTSKTLVLITLLLIFCPIILLAQGAPPATPIDGGLSLLLIAGGAYGLKKIIKKK